jgi:hypothetical protein
MVNDDPNNCHRHNGGAPIHHYQQQRADGQNRLPCNWNESA